MAELSDIEECAVGHDAEGGTVSWENGVTAGSENPHYDYGDDFWLSIGRKKGERIQRQHYDEIHQQSQSSPASANQVSPSLPSSSSSSSRTITPPDKILPSQRQSSSGTVQIASTAAASATSASRVESSTWSSASGPSYSYGTASGTASSATLSGYYRHNRTQPQQQQQQQQQQQRHRPYVLGDVPPAGRPPFWWMGSPASGPRSPERDNDGEQDCLLGHTSDRDEQKKIQWVFHLVMHGVVLVLQSGVALGVLCVFVWTALWKDANGETSDASSSLLRKTPYLATAFVLVLSFATLLIHEVYLLSPVVLLYLQAAILSLTTVSATSMWMNCVREDDFVLKGVLISCSVVFWATSGLAFLKAVIIWKVTGLSEDEASTRNRGIHGERYDTFQGSA